MHIFFKFKNCRNHILFTSPTLFPLLTIVMQFLFTKQNNIDCTNSLGLCSLLYIYAIIHKNTPNSLWKKAQCRNPKKVSKKVATFEKTTVLCRSTFFISLWLSVTKTLACLNAGSIVLSQWRVGKNSYQWIRILCFPHSRFTLIPQLFCCFE